MTAQEGNLSGNDSGGASGSALSAPQICRHRGHFEFRAKRLVYKGLGSYDYAYFTVYSHHKRWRHAKQDILCNKEYGLYTVLGTPEELDLKVICPIGEKA